MTMAESQASPEQALKKVEDQLTCAVCLDTFKQPKLLNCFHVFCEHCLQRLVVQEGQGQLSICCPTCRRSTLLSPATSVSALQSAFHVYHLFEIQYSLKKMKEPTKVQCEKCTKRVSRPATDFCRDCGQFICAKCVDIHQDWDEFSTHEVVSINQLQGNIMSEHIPLRKVKHFCSKHKDQQLRLYCEDCDELICHDCTVRLHRGHQYDLISDMLEGHKADIETSLGPVRKLIDSANVKLKQLDSRRSEITLQQDLVEARVHKEVQSFIELLKRRESQLVSQLDIIAQAKLKNITVQREETETALVQLGSCLSFVEESLKTGSDGEIVKMRNRVVKQIKEMTAEITVDTPTRCEEANMGFVTSPKFAEGFSTYNIIGDVYLQVVTPKNCYAGGKGLEVAIMNEEATAFIYALDQRGKSCDHCIDKITCELISETNFEHVIIGKVSVKKDNCYVICYQATRIGRHQLHIKISGVHIKESPFAVTVRRPLEKLGTPITIITGVNGPWGVAVNKKGEIVVVENKANCVTIFSQAGEKLRSFGSEGSEKGQFSEPRGVAVDGNGNILVADAVNNRIQKFTSDGTFITAVGCRGRKPLQFDLPSGIAIHPTSDRVYVSESRNYRIQILNPDLTQCGMFGSKGSSKGQFYLPKGLAFDNEHESLYVSQDRQNTRIQVLSAKGGHLRWLGDKLNAPFDVKVDLYNTIYVCDTKNHQVCIFDSSGQLLQSFGTRGTQPGQFESPYGLTVDINGLIYVSDFRNNRIQIF